MLLRSYVLRRPAGNVIVYNSPGIATAAAEIESIGGASQFRAASCSAMTSR